MIEPNLGSVERALRLLLSLGLICWLALRPEHDGWSVAAAIAALALGMNALYARCYLWSLLGFNSCRYRPGARTGARQDA